MLELCIDKSGMASVLLGMAPGAFGGDASQNWWFLVGSPNPRRRRDGNCAVIEQRGAQGLPPVTLRELLVEMLVWVEVNTSEQANLAV